MEIKIDPEFRDLLPPLPVDRRAKLEANILRDGCREPIMLWNSIIADGYNRHEICTRHSLGYQTNYLDPAEFPDRDSVMLWMLDNQTGRRNESDIDRIAIAAKRAEILARQAQSNSLANLKQNQGTDPAISPSRSVNTRAEAAKTAGVGEKKYDEGKVILEAVASGEAPAELLDDIREKKVSVHKAATQIKEARKPAPAEEWSTESKAAADEAAKDSENLFMLKSAWRKASKKDRALFMEWAKSPT